MNENLVDKVTKMREDFFAQLAESKDHDGYANFVLQFFVDPPVIDDFLDLIAWAKLEGIDLEEDEHFKEYLKFEARRQFAAAKELIFRSEESNLGLMSES